MVQLKFTGPSFVRFNEDKDDEEDKLKHGTDFRQFIQSGGKYHEVETKIRRVDKRLALGFPIKDGTKKDEKNKKAILCNSEFPIGVRPGAVIPEHTRELRRMALNRHESLEYIGRQTTSSSCPLFKPPLLLMGRNYPLVKREKKKIITGWAPRGPRAKSAPPHCYNARPTSAQMIGIDLTQSETDGSQSFTEEEQVMIDPNYLCECFIGEEEEVIEDEEPDDLSLAKYIAAIEVLTDTSMKAVFRHFSTFSAARDASPEQLEQIKEYLESSDERQRYAVIMLCEKLAVRDTMGEALTRQILSLILKRWNEEISASETYPEILSSTVQFVQQIISKTNSDLWMDDIYKEQLIDRTTAQIQVDPIRARYCTMMLRVLSDEKGCAHTLAHTALPVCIALPIVKQDYWDTEKSEFKESDIFLQEEILKIFCNIAQASSYARKLLICHGIIDTVSKILAYANCPVQYQAALLVGSLCEDHVGCEHVTSSLTNQRADRATCMRNLGNLFTHSKCLRVRAACGCAMSRMFSTPDKKLANRGLAMVHHVLFSDPAATRDQRPKTAPPVPSLKHPNVGLGTVKDVLQRYALLCTTAGPFHHSHFFRCRLMALESVNTLLSFPCTRDDEAFHFELARAFFTKICDSLLKDVRKIAEKHRYVKDLQDKIVKIQVNLLTKMSRNERLSELLNIELEEIKNDNSVIKIPKRDFELAKNELIFCETVIHILQKTLSVIGDTGQLAFSRDVIEDTRRHNTLQDSLYARYATSLQPERPDESRRPSVEQNNPKHLPFIKRLLAHGLVETLVPWLGCVYPPVTQVSIQCLSHVFIYARTHSITVLCETVEPYEDQIGLHPSDIASYFSSKSVMPSHLTNSTRSIQLTDEAKDTPEPAGHLQTLAMSQCESVVENCTQHIGHLCSSTLTQRLLVCNNSVVSRTAAQLLRDIANTVSKEDLLCMIDDNLLERVTEYLILSSGNESSISIALDILQTLLIFQPTLGKLFNRDGGLDQLVGKLLATSSEPLRQRVLETINMFPTDEMWCRSSKSTREQCEGLECPHQDVWHKVVDKWDTQDSVSRLMTSRT